MKLAHFLLVFSFLTLISLIAIGQDLEESHLPIVVIELEDQTIKEIFDEPKTIARMGIIDNGPNEINSIDDPWNDYDGYIGIETRGNSTQGFEKKTYSVELWDEQENDISASILGMGVEEDWILHAMVIDKTQLRIPMSFYLFQRMGHYASNWRFVELVINEEYRGLYILTEKIKRDNDRVDIAKLDNNDLAGDSLTGGYILRIDWLDDAEGFESEFEAQGGDNMFYQWYYPKAENIQEEQAEYIADWMYEFESAVFEDDYINDAGKRYDEYIDITTFTDFLLINELSKNADGYKLSTYMHKDRDDRDGRLKAGPIWDFDQTYGMSAVCSNFDTEEWTYTQEQDGCEDLESMPMWWQAMMADTIFTNHLSCRWETMRAGAFHEDSLHTWIDDQVAYLGAAIDRNFERWDFLGEAIWIEPDPLPLDTYQEEIDYMKNWISDRLNWLDENMPGNCENDIIVIEEPTEVQSLYNDFNIELSPNPAQDFVQISAKRELEVIIHNIDGKILYINELNTMNKTIDLSHFEAGIYFVKVKDEDQQRVMKLVVN